jgi:Kef-type K+ transport system membrane component KefB
VGASVWLGLPLHQGIVIGGVVSIASTMVMTRLLIDRGELRTEHGMVMVSITLVEDIAVVVLMVLIPSVGNLGVSRLMSILLGLGRAAVILVPAFFVAAKIVPSLLIWSDPVNRRLSSTWFSGKREPRWRQTKRVTERDAIATMDHSDIRGSKPHSCDTSGATSN